ncbi:MAG: signal peptidase II [Sporomusaceae bacterium]|nr:signal peptidase II [Sporomusaceae bacterium]
MNAWCVVATVIILDQLSKYYISHTFQPDMSIPIIRNVFHLTYVLNPGAAFGILVNQQWLFITIALIIFGAILYFYRKIPPTYRLFRFGISLMAGGACGNVIDRIYFGYVIDFFDFRIWPVFNVADIAIVCGVGFMIYTILFTEKKDEML